MVAWHGSLHGGVFTGWHARVYDRCSRWVVGGLYRRVAEEVAAVAPTGGRVLDVGTGPGWLPVEIARRRPDLRVTGVDVAPDMVALAGGHAAGLNGRVEAVLGDVVELPFPDDRFDLVVSTLSMHHWPDVDHALPELGRVLRPGGQVWIYDVRVAPFDRLDAVVAASAALADRSPGRDRVGTKWFPVPLYTRYTF
ncbi:MAG: class I SAM-dependent methyltransferase [Actinomycetales bacterium]|nr:class I SAM-dependent methyltransferase [Actinomycetales bacterium]